MPVQTNYQRLQIQQNLNRPNNNDAMDPTSLYALAEGTGDGSTFPGTGGGLQFIDTALRQLSLDPAWVTLKGLLGTWAGGLQATFIDGTHFSIQEGVVFTGVNVSNYFNIGRRVRFYVSAGTLYGTVTAITTGGGINTITVAMDSGALDAGLNTPGGGGGGDAQPSSLDPTSNPTPGNVFTQQHNPLFAVVSNGGAGNAYTDQGAGTTAITPPLAGYSKGSLFCFTFVQGLTAPITVGQPTVNIGPSGGLGAVPITKNGTTQLLASDIIAGQTILCEYDGAEFQIIGTITEPPIVSTVDNGGTGPTFTGTVTPALNTYLQNVIYLFRFTHGNSTVTPAGTDTTVNLTPTGGSPLGAIPLKKQASVALDAGDIVAGQIIACAFDGVNFQVLGGLNFVPAAAGGLLTVTITDNQNLNTGALTALNTSAPLTITPPKGGGPFRIHVSWNCAISGVDLPSTQDAEVGLEISDGTNIWARGYCNIPKGECSGAAASALSPTTYAAGGAAVTLTLLARAIRADGSGGGLGGASAIRAKASDLAGVTPSQITAVFIPCN